MATFNFYSSLRSNRKSRVRILRDGREILGGYAYDRRRLDVLRRDRFNCTQCGSAHSVAVHHIKKRSLVRDDRMTNLTTLCWDCHEAAHRRIA